MSAAGRLFQLLPTNAIDTQEPFAAGEDPVAYVMDSLRWIYPPIDMVLETRAAGSPLRDGVSSQRCVCVCVNRSGPRRRQTSPSPGQAPAGGAPRCERRLFTAAPAGRSHEDACLGALLHREASERELPVSYLALRRWEHNLFWVNWADRTSLVPGDALWGGGSRAISGNLG